MKRVHPSVCVCVLYVCACVCAGARVCACASVCTSACVRELMHARVCVCINVINEKQKHTNQLNIHKQQSRVCHKWGWRKVYHQWRHTGQWHTITITSCHSLPQCNNRYLSMTLKNLLGGLGVRQLPVNASFVKYHCKGTPKYSHTCTLDNTDTFGQRLITTNHFG